VAFDGALKVKVPAIEGTHGERTTAGLMHLGLFLFPLFFGGHLPPTCAPPKILARLFSVYSPEFS